MRTAIISDIHGNYEGLMVALEDIGNNNCERIICLGDMVDGGDGNEAVVNEIIRLGIPSVRGNHDENNDLRLTEETKIFLKNLPEEIIEEDVFYTHISPRKKKRKIDNEYEAWNVFDETEKRIIFVGHVHVPLIFGERCKESFTAERYKIDYNTPIEVDKNDRYIICVGSIGYGRDLLGKIRYSIYDSECNTVEFKALEGPLLAYDWGIQVSTNGCK